MLDIHRRMKEFSRECLKEADSVVLVAELSLASLRDTLRLSDLMVDIFKMSPPIIVVNRCGISSKSEMNAADFEKGITAKIVEKISYAPELFSYIGVEIPSIVNAKNPVMKPLYSLAKQLLPNILADGEIKEKGGLAGFMKKKKKDE